MHGHLNVKFLLYVFEAWSLIKGKENFMTHAIPITEAEE